MIIKMANSKNWQAISDANILASYLEIMDDTKRRNAAMKEAKNRAADLNKRAAAMLKAAGGKISTRKK